MPTQPTRPIPGGKSLELTMRDVMDGLADSACQLAYSSASLDMEILSLAVPEPNAPPTQRAPVVAVSTARSQNIVDYLIRRESNLMYLTASA